MTSLIDEIIASDSYQQKLIEPMIASFVARLKRPGAEGKAYREFIFDWLYLNRPLIDRFEGARFNVQFEGPAVMIDGTDYPLGGFVHRGVERARIDPVAAFRLRRELRAAVDAVVERSISGPMQFLPAIPEKPFADHAKADADAERIIQAYAATTGKPEGGN